MKRQERVDLPRRLGADNSPFAELATSRGKGEILELAQRLQMALPFHFGISRS
jgi:hypothetical protein